MLSRGNNGIQITRQDIQDLDVSKRSLSTGWKKVIGACAHAQKDDFEWIWIDSCCIDKSSNANLSENLDRYYANAGVCYVHLPDVSSEEDPKDAKSGFRRSKWFMRGRTLQELIALSQTVFLDDSWKEIGTRYGLRDAISAITFIPVELFEGKDPSRYLAKYTIANAEHHDGPSRSFDDINGGYTEHDNRKINCNIEKCGVYCEGEHTYTVNNDNWKTFIAGGGMATTAFYAGHMTTQVEGPSILTNNFEIAIIYPQYRFDQVPSFVMSLVILPVVLINLFSSFRRSFLTAFAQGVGGT
ncbi:hypothetical protein K435DRAFT_784653 [Dendrothele bispora CBS 962.96]|uniref:Uncharacterized protein n=1 Tax=Dendrothele bispora (strain CBS 962.96) TaxID=1314807 RepID=A0A4S8L1M2_DENBC|nr:hypothetical protein K435DRAFT_784653 [Dendrothele bispora CBS 962.96]